MPRFDSERRAALMADLVRPLLGRPADLLSFDEVRERLHLRSVVDRGLQDVPLERIVGTVGREREFTRAFLPREEALRERWEDVKRLAEGPSGFPPVELYNVGGTYFVVDGHHRVSVARARGAPSIEARVREYPTPVSLAADADPTAVALESGRAEFLEVTGLEPAGPGEFRVSEPDGYERLLAHIAGHRYFRGIELGRPVAWDEAVASWRDTVYRPMVETIRGSGILEDFPGLTETDLYLFVMDHLHHLRETYGPGEVEPEEAVEDFRVTQLPVRSGWRARLRRWLRRG